VRAKISGMRVNRAGGLLDEFMHGWDLVMQVP